MTPAPDSQPVQVPLAKLPRPTEFDRLAVITIQGGGIYGLNLLGQLSYLTEKLKVVPVAVAGNSAGSVVAALFWAGYTPWQIRNIFADLAGKQQLAALVGPFVPTDSPYTLSDFRSLKTDCERLADHSLAGDEPRSWFGWAKRWVGTPIRAIGTWLSLWDIRNRITPHFITRGCFLARFTYGLPAR